jgi:hypothetical protein
MFKKYDFFLGVKISCVEQEFRLPPKFVGYITGHYWDPVVISHKDGVSLGEEPGVLCD